MKTNLKLMVIEGKSEYVAIKGSAECITPYKDWEGDHLIGWCNIIQRIGVNHLEAILMDPPTHELLKSSDVDYRDAIWEYPSNKHTHRGRRSNSNNKKRARQVALKQRFDEEELPF